MSSYTPEVGHRVRVSFEADVAGPWDHKLEPSNLHHFVGAGYTFTLPRDITVLRVPNPELHEVAQPGDVITCHDHGPDSFMRTGEGWVGPRGQTLAADHFIGCDTAFLVVDGKPVQS